MELFSGLSQEFLVRPPGTYPIRSLTNYFLRIGNGVGKQGYGNRPPIDDRKPIRKFSIDCLDASKNQRVNSASTDSPLQRIKEKSRYGISVSTPHRRYGHRLRTPFLRTPFPRLLYFGNNLETSLPGALYMEFWRIEKSCEF